MDSMSDAWVLLSVIYGGGPNGAGLRSILSAGDYLNHAVMSYEELNNGLAHLLAAGHLTEHNGVYFPSAAVLAAYELPAKKRRTSSAEWDLLELFLADNSFPPENRIAAPAVISRDDYEQALQAYLPH